MSETPESPWGQAPPVGPEYASYEPTRPYQGGGPTGPTPPRGGRGVLVTLLVVAVVAVVGIVVTVVALAGGDEPTPVADPSTTVSRTSDPSSPSSDPSSEATTPVSSDPPSSDPPSSPGAPVDPTSAFSYTEYGDDWNFRYGDVALQADFQQGWDYPDCSTVEIDDSLTSIGCVRASEWTLRALDGKLAMTHIVLTMDSPAAAKRAVDDELIGGDSFNVEPAGLLGGDASAGTFRGDFTTDKPFVVLTVETHAPEVRQAKADEFRNYGTADITAALGFRF